MAQTRLDRVLKDLQLIRYIIDLYLYTIKNEQNFKRFLITNIITFQLK